MKKIFENLSIKIFSYIYKKQEEKHKKRMEKLNKKILSGSVCGEKIHTAKGATLSIKKQSETEQTSKLKIKKIVEQYLDNPKKIFEYIKGAKTSIIINKNADKILAFIGEDEGFIYPKKGLKALYLNLLLNNKISFSTNDMFVMRSYDINIYALIYQFYNWYCYKMKLDGFEIKTQEKFKHVFKYCETSKINELSFEEILNMKSAIKRDIEAIDFVKEIVSDVKMAKKNLDKIKHGEKVCV